MVEVKIGLLAEQELVTHLEQERARLRWSLRTRSNSRSAEAGSADPAEQAAHLAQQYAALDRLAEIEGALQQLTQDRGGRPGSGGSRPSLGYFVPPAWGTVASASGRAARA